MGSGDLTTQKQGPTAEEILAAAQQRIKEREQQEKEEEAQLSPQARTWALRANRFVFQLSKHWLAFFNTFLTIFVGGAFLAPISMAMGWTNLGTSLYHIYSATCHQLAFRSWFITGASPIYPYPPPQDYETYNQLRTFLGDAQLGYKVAICERDVAIYGTMLLAGIAYNWLRRKPTVRTFKPYIFIISMIPMGLDGGFQWITYFVYWIIHPAWLAAPHETTPLLRTLTGAIFGLGTIVFGYPHMETFFRDIYQLLHQRYGWK